MHISKLQGSLRAVQALAVRLASMPEAHCGMHTAHIFILLCVPWLVYSEGAAKSGSAASFPLPPCPTSRALYGANGLPCNPGNRPGTGSWNTLGNGGRPAQAGWSGGSPSNNRQPGSWNTVANGLSPGQAGLSGGSTGNNRQPGSWNTVANGFSPGQAGWSGGSTSNNRQTGSWNTGGSSANPGQGGWPGVLGGAGGYPQTPRQPTGGAGGNAVQGGLSPTQGGGGSYPQTGRHPTGGYTGSGRRPQVPGQPGYRPHRPTRHPHPFRQPKFCLLRAVGGPCRAFLSRWHYNHVTRHCEKFVYGGCLGNKNNFVSCQQCLQVCTGNPRTHHGKRCGRRWSPYMYISAGREK